MGVSRNNGTRKSSILIGFSIINHPFWGTPIFGNTHIGFTKIPGWKINTIVPSKNFLPEKCPKDLTTWNLKIISTTNHFIFQVKC